MIVYKQNELLENLVKKFSDGGGAMTNAEEEVTDVDLFLLPAKTCSDLQILNSQLLPI